MYKEVKLINHDCLPILILMYIMLYIMLAYLMLFAALSNPVCLHNAFFLFVQFFVCFVLVDPPARRNAAGTLLGD